MLLHSTPPTAERSCTVEESPQGYARRPFGATVAERLRVLLELYAPHLYTVNHRCPVPNAAHPAGREGSGMRRRYIRTRGDSGTAGRVPACMDNSRRAWRGGVSWTPPFAKEW